MPIQYEMRFESQTTKTGESRTSATDHSISIITMDEKTSIFLKTPIDTIFTSSNRDGNLEIFTTDQSILIIENFFTTAANSRIYFQNITNNRLYTEYSHEQEKTTDYSTLLNTIDEDQNSNQIEIPQDTIESAKKIHSDAKIAKYNAEQALYKELFKKDNFSTGPYKISFNQSTNNYIATDMDIDFLEIAKENFEIAQENFDYSEDMVPDALFSKLNDVVESMTSNHLKEFFFKQNGEFAFNVKYLSNTGVWSVLPSGNYLQAAITHDYMGRHLPTPIPVFRSVEMLAIRDNKINALQDFEKNYGKQKELIFKLGNLAYEIGKTEAIPPERTSFFTEIKSKEKNNAEEILDKIKELFPEIGDEPDFNGSYLNELLSLLKKHASLESDAESAQNAFTKIDNLNDGKIQRNESPVKIHLNTVTEKEINENHYQYASQLVEALKKSSKYEEQTKYELKFLQEIMEEHQEAFDHQLHDQFSEIIDNPTTINESVENDQIVLTGNTTV